MQAAAEAAAHDAAAAMRQDRGMLAAWPEEPGSQPLGAEPFAEQTADAWAAAKPPPATELQAAGRHRPMSGESPPSPPPPPATELQAAGRQSSLPGESPPSPPPPPGQQPQLAALRGKLADAFEPAVALLRSAAPAMRPGHIEDCAEEGHIFLEPRPARRRYSKPKQRPLDTWTHTGGTSVAKLTLPQRLQRGARPQQLIRRVGKVHRHGLPPLRFVHFELSPWDPEGAEELLGPVLFYVYADAKLRLQHERKQADLLQEQLAAEAAAADAGAAASPAAAHATSTSPLFGAASWEDPAEMSWDALCRLPAVPAVAPAAPDPSGTSPRRERQSLRALEGSSMPRDPKRHRSLLLFGGSLCVSVANRFHVDGTEGGRQLTALIEDDTNASAAFVPAWRVLGMVRVLGLT